MKHNFASTMCERLLAPQGPQEMFWFSRSESYISSWLLWRFLDAAFSTFEPHTAQRTTTMFCYLSAVVIHWWLSFCISGLLAVMQWEHLCSRDLNEARDSNYIAGVVWAMKSFLLFFIFTSKNRFLVVIEHNTVLSSPFQQFTHPADTEQH